MQRGRAAATGDEGRATRLAVSLSGTNLARAGDYNQRTVVQAIRMAGETTRVDLAQITGLTPPTIANITRRLMDDGLVIEAGRRQGGRGQPAVRLTINPDGCFAIGLNIDRDHITLVTLDLTGQVRSRSSCEIAFAMPEQVVTYVRDSLDTLLAEGGVARERVIGVGVALPDELGRIELPGKPAGYDRWSGLRADELLAEVLPWPIHLDNDAAAAALGEAQCGKGLNLPSFFYLLISAGLGGGLVVERSFYEGATGRSGEIGLMPDPSAGHPGAIVQDIVSLSGLFDRLDQAGQTMQDVAGLAELDAEGRAVVDIWLSDATRALLTPLVAVNCLFNPDAILVGGRLPLALTDALVARLDEALSAMALPSHAPIIRAAMAEDASAIGAAILPFLDQVLPSDAILMQAGRERA